MRESEEGKGTREGVCCTLLCLLAQASSSSDYSAVALISICQRRQRITQGGLLYAGSPSCMHYQSPPLSVLPSRPHLPAQATEHAREYCALLATLLPPSLLYLHVTNAHHLASYAPLTR